jgi:hypothetical protein
MMRMGFTLLGAACPPAGRARSAEQSAVLLVQ